MKTRRAWRPNNGSQRGQKASLRRTVPLAVAAAAAVSLAACGGGSSAPGVASGGSSTATATHGGGPASGSSYDKALAYSRCMRSHGVADFPDPNVSRNGQAAIDTSSPQFQAADSACRSLAPGGSEHLSQAQLAELRAEELRFSRCARAHGISNFPDPGPSGNLDFDGIDRNSPQWQRAWQACRSELPNNGAKKPPAGNGGP
jgi:hypothetical protein